MTEYEVARLLDAATLVQVRIHTGRSHQIRMHFAEAGHPILADALYGGRRRERKLPVDSAVRRAAEAIGRQALHAQSLGFSHPTTGAKLIFRAPLPDDFLRALAQVELPADKGAEVD